MESATSSGGDQSIHSAAKTGQREDVEFVLNQGAGVEDLDDTGRTAFLYAVQRGHLEIVKLLIEEGANVHASDRGDGWGPLHFAAREGHLELVKFLTKSGAMVHDCNNSSAKPLHIAAEHGHKDVAEFLLKLGANLDSVDQDYCTPLHYAARKGQLEMVKFLTAEGADANVNNRLDETALHMAAKYGHKYVVEFFLDLGRDIDCKDHYSGSPLYTAVKHGHLEVAKLLVDRGADFKKKRVLHCAAQYGRKDFLEFFFTLGVDINTDIDNYTDNKTPLHYAAWEGNLEIAKLLVESGANARAENYEGDQPIHFAAKNGKVDVVQFFLELGINVDVRNLRGLTPLHGAAKGGSIEVITFLVENKANIDKQDVGGVTPLHYAAEKGHLGVVRLLVENKANVNIQDAEGRTPLCHSAMGECSVIVAEHLINVGANPDIPDRKGKTLLHHVIKNRHNGMPFFRYILKQQKDVNAKDIDGYTPLNSLLIWWVKIRTYCPNPESVIYYMPESIDLLIEAGAYITPVDYLGLIKVPSLKEHVTKNVKLCTQVIVNKFNNQDLPALYKLHDPSNLPPIENMKIRTNSNVMREIERIIDNEIKSVGYYNMREIERIIDNEIKLVGYYNMGKSPILLTMLSMEVCIRPETVHDNRRNEQKCLQSKRRGCILFDRDF